jgi:hypothetical protein
VVTRVSLISRALNCGGFGLPGLWARLRSANAATHPPNCLAVSVPSPQGASGVILCPYSQKHFVIFVCAEAFVLRSHLITQSLA